MDTQEHHEPVQGLTDEQLEQRRGKVMASDVSSYLGINPWSSALASWAKNLGLEAYDRNPDTDMGLFLEQGLLNAATHRLSMGGYTCPGTVFHPVETWAGCTPDAIFARTDEPIQIKNHGLHMARDFDGDPEGEPEELEAAAHNDLIPEWHLLQVQWELFVTQRPSGWLGAYFGGRDFRLFHIARDEDLIRMMVERLRMFWEYHLDTSGPQSEPPADGGDAAREYLRRRYPRNAQQEDLIEPTPEHREMAARYLDLHNRLKELEKAKDEVQNRLMQEIGGHDGIAGIATWKLTSPKKPKTDWEALAKSMPGHEHLVDQYTALPEPQRHFNLTYKPE